jgi:hypothetical protein
MVVELDVFSGRPNPRWELDRQTTSALQRLLRRLKRTAARPPEPPGLGYRGFVWMDGSDVVRAYRGYVRTPRAVYGDPSMAVEKLLLQRLPSEFEQLRTRIDAELK